MWVRLIEEWLNAATSLCSTTKRCLVSCFSIASIRCSIFSSAGLHGSRPRRRWLHRFAGSAGPGANRGGHRHAWRVTYRRHRHPDTESVHGPRRGLPSQGGTTSSDHADESASSRISEVTDKALSVRHRVLWSEDRTARSARLDLDTLPETAGDGATPQDPTAGGERLYCKKTYAALLRARCSGVEFMMMRRRALNT
jgi:hypothetical protein